MDKLRVLVAEDHEDFRGIVVALLSSEFQIVGAVGDGEQLAQAAMFLQPDVVVSDIRMPVMNGFSARNELRSKGFIFPFVFMTTFDLKGVFNTEDAPVGYLHKNDLFNELKLAIQAVARGNSYMSQTFRENKGDE